MTITERMIWAAANVLIAETPMRFDAAERLAQLSLVLRGLRDGGADYARGYKLLILERGVK